MAWKQVWACPGGLGSGTANGVLLGHQSWAWGFIRMLAQGECAVTKGSLWDVGDRLCVRGLWGLHTLHLRLCDCSLVLETRQRDPDYIAD